MASENSVTTVYRRINLANITSGASSSIDPIGWVAFGDGGVDSIGNPIPPDTESTSLNNEIARYPIDSVSYPTPTTAQYTCTIPAPDLPGAQISEAAITDSGTSGGLCAIITFFVKQKDPGASFTFTFNDEF